MALGKIILAIFGILLLILIVVGIDGYMTYKAFDDLDSDDVSNLVSDPQFDVSGVNSEIVTVSVLVDLPSAGFIPKGVEIKLTVDFDGNVQTETKSVDLGDSKTIEMQFTMTTANADTLATGGSLTVSAEAEATPTIFGYAISQATQDIDLGSQTVTKP